MQENHRTDGNGNPMGGTTIGEGFTIEWQNGALVTRDPKTNQEVRRKPNGAFVEDVIKAAKGRLVFYQGTPFACPENYDAIEKLNEALYHLESRTLRRVEEGIEGKHEQGEAEKLYAATPVADDVTSENQEKKPVETKSGDFDLPPLG